MARGIRLTKQERDVLRILLDPATEGSDPGLDRKQKAARDSILAKLDASEEAPKGVSVEPIEDALIASARGKVVALEAGHARASVQAKAVGATPEDAKLVGAWMARQGWLSGPQTLIDVLNKWYQWLPKARATEPPPALQPGLGTDAKAERGPGTPGEAHPPGRPAPGFR